MKHTKITAVFGTRPEAIKMCPLILELKKRKHISLSVIVSGQHRELCREVLEYFGVVPDLDLNIMSHGQTLFDITEKILTKMETEMSENRTDLLLVHGDTSTAFASALAAFYTNTPIGHVEAGLRSNDLFSPYPEEFNRRAIDAMSFLHFCPTFTSKMNLISEGVPSQRIFVTGNTVVDALGYTLEGRRVARAHDGTRLLLTLHRRENRGEGMLNILKAVKRAAERYGDLKITFPMHPSSEVREAAKILSDLPNAELTDSLPLPDFHRLLRECDIVLSDSGGITEEAVSLGKPLLLARNTTERPEGFLAGISLVGTEEDTVFDALCHLIESKGKRQKASSGCNIFGDGRASERIADILLSFNY